MEEKKKYTANALLRGLEILKLFNEENPTLSLVEISRKLGVNRTVPYRLLYTLQSAGYIQQNQDTKRYSLTPKVLELGFAYMNSLKLPEIAHPYMESLRDELGASCHLSILDGSQVVYVGTSPVRGLSAINVNLGLRLPAYATANGRVLLAYKPEEEVKLLLSSTNLTPYTESTVISVTELLEKLKIIRGNGYAITYNEFKSTLSSVAVPIFDRAGEILAALNVVIIDSDFPDEFMEEIALPKLLDLSKMLSSYMGFHSS